VIGTTDVEYKGDPSKVAIDQQEIEYLCDIANQHFVKQVSPDDVISTWSGVRPLCEDESSDAQAVTRDYTIELDESQPKAPLLSIFGGKLTTYRKLGQAAVDQLATFFPHMSPAWTREAVLPGGDFADRETLTSSLSKHYPWLDDKVLNRYVKAYGTLAISILEQKSNISELGFHFGHGLYQTEVDYLTPI
jgi:glycerol-3-phosphate dehydrogenase